MIKLTETQEIKRNRFAAIPTMIGAGPPRRYVSYPTADRARFY
jgi:hypothetical protein